MKWNEVTFIILMILIAALGVTSMLTTGKFSLSITLSITAVTLTILELTNDKIKKHEVDFINRGKWTYYLILLISLLGCIGQLFGAY